MKAELDRQFSQLSELIITINQPLDKLDRKKLITLCTIDVHARDVVQRLIDERVDDAMCFPWQSQLRYVCVCVRACVCACVRMCVCVCV
jgi:dynein heavy chain